MDNLRQMPEYDRYGLYGVGHPAGRELVNDPPGYEDVAWRRMAEAGATSVRLAASWREIEAVKGKYDWSSIEATLNYCRKYHWIRPYLLVVNTPGWARPDGTPSHYPPMFEAIGDWKRYCNALAKRYKGFVRHYEVWNEQNGFGWESPPYNQPERYLPIIEAAYDGLKEGDPDCVVGFGALDNAEGYSPIFTKGAYELRLKKYGNRKLWESFGDHPYGDRESMMTKLRVLKGIQDSYGDFGMDYWLTEYGFTLKNVTEEEQARLLTEFMTTLIEDEEFRYVTETNYLAIGDFEGHYLNWGLCDANLRPRPAFYAYQRLPRPGKIVISDIHVQHLSATSARISWRTDVECESWVEINNKKIDDARPAQDHFVVVGDLDPESSYTYIIGAQAEGFPEAQSLDYELRTLAYENLRNSGFEDGFVAGIAVDWECVGKNYCYDSSGLVRILDIPHSRQHTQCIAAYGEFGVGLDDAVTAHAAVEIGKEYAFSAWTYALSEAGDGYIERKVGIDPAGGKDPKSPNVIWSEPRGKMEVWDKQQVTAAAQSSVITVFAHAFTSRINDDRDLFFVDDAELTC